MLRSALRQGCVRHGGDLGSARRAAARWAIDGAALVVATGRQGCDCVAAGFLVFVAGESLLLAGNAAGLAASVPSYGGGVALWAASLAMTSVPSTFALWTRLVGVVAAVLFAVTAALIAWGEPLLPTSSPLPTLGYPFLVLTFVGWIWRLLKPPAA